MLMNDVLKENGIKCYGCVNFREPVNCKKNILVRCSNINLYSLNSLCTVVQ